jgi:2-keto-3-deoxy-L-rhamnonate aldolase RhmA
VGDRHPGKTRLLDFIFIDGEHGPFGLDQFEDLCRTAERHNSTTIARVPDIGSSTILRYLDRGIMGILGPHIATEADARRLVRACYFGPLGERSTIKGVPLVIRSEPMTTHPTARRNHA